MRGIVKENLPKASPAFKEEYVAKLTNAYLSNPIQPIICLEQFTDDMTLPYVEDLQTPKLGDHNGQRKLFNAMVGFMTRAHQQFGDNITCIYAGAAPNQYGCLISKLYPNDKFIYIDPNPFRIDKYAGDKTDEPHRIHILWPKDAADDIPEANCVKLMNDLKDRPAGLYIINALMTDNLARAARVLGNIVFASDIRTNSNNGSHQPDTLDIYWNLAQMYVWCKIMDNVLYAQFKWRHPFYSINDLDSFAAEPYATTFRIAKEYGLDFVEQARTKNLRFFDGIQYLQHSAGISSTELRLESDCKEIKDYGQPEKNDNQLFAWNSIYRNFQLFKNPYVDQTQGFCLCGDCAILAETFHQYCTTFDVKDEKKWVADILKRLQIITQRPLRNHNHGYLYERYPLNIIRHIFQANITKQDPENWYAFPRNFTSEILRGVKKGGGNSDVYGGWNSTYTNDDVAHITAQTQDRLRHKNP